MLQNILFAALGIIAGAAFTIWLASLRPRLIMHPDIHWSREDGAARVYRIRLRNNGLLFHRGRAGDQASHEERADGRWGHIFDLTVTASLIIPSQAKPSNRHRIALPLGAAAEYPHIQPGDTRFVRLAGISFSAEGRSLLAQEAKDRGKAEPDSGNLLHDLADWQGAKLVIVAIGNDAFGGGRRCWEKRYNLHEDPLRTGDFPASDEVCRR